jgi:Protein of unknown function (DUF3311)
VFYWLGMRAETGAADGTRPDPAGAATKPFLRQQRPWAVALFVLTVAVVVVPALYNRIHPELAGVPFFIWYQFVAVVFGAVVTGIVYMLRGTEKHLARAQDSAGPPAPRRRRRAR